jgi:tetratricopeptide (TPR) repeat protein
VLALVVGSLAMLWAWRVARRRRLQAVSGPSTSVRGSGAFDGVLEQQSALIARLKEAGNRAYLQRDYEGAAQHFAQAVQETLQRCRLAHPELTLRPVAQARELTAAEQHAAKEADALGHGPEVASYPPPGSLSTTPNPHLAQLPVDTSNSLAIFYSNRSACLLALNRYEDALVDAECAVHCQPLWSKGFLRAGQAYESLGLFERAESMYLRGAQRDPRDENVARCVANLRSLQKEVADTRRAIARDEQRTRRITARRALTQSAGSSEVSVPQAPATALESDKFDKLTAWLLEHGARFPSLYLKQYSSEHRGVHTLCRIAAGKIVLEVPLRCIMTTDLARASPVGRAIDRTSVELSSNHSYLACYLLEERAKGDASFWSPYINILPREYASMPVFFDEEDKGWLKGSLTLPKIDERRRELANEYERICSKIDAEDLSEGHVDKEAAARGQQKATASFAELRGPFSARHNLSAFIWARSVVITRIFGFSMDVPANNTSSSDRGGILQLRTIKTDGLVPMADMLNHFRPRQTAWAYFNERGAFCITSLIPFTAGSEVCDSYGRKCQSRFFINYGFALLGNDEDNQAALWVHLDGRENVREGHLLADEDEDTDDTEDVLAKRKWLLAISGNQVDERAAASQSLQQSASSLSSSSFVLSPSVDDGDSSIVSSPSSFPPPSTLRFQLPTDPNDRIFKEVFSVLRVVVASTTARARAFTPPPAQDGSISASVALSAALRHAISKSHLSEVGAIDLIIAQTANGDRELGLRSVPPLSLRNELAVLHALRQAAQEALAQFSCTMAEDDVLLARDDELQEQAAEKRRAADAAGRDFDDAEAQLTEGRLTINQRNCVIMRRGEKQVLQHFIDMAAEARWLVAQWRAAIPLPNSDVAAASSSAGQTETPWDTFLTVVAEPRYGNQQQGPLVTYVTHVLLPLLRAETNFEKQQAAAAAAQR